MAKNTVPPEAAAAAPVAGPQAAPTSGPMEPRELLKALDGWLEATGHGAEHPWRQSIARSVHFFPSNEPRRVLFEPFAWHQVPQESVPLLAARQADFAGQVLDVASGVRDVLRLIERDTLDEHCSDETGATLPALLPANVSGSLTRLCIAALGMMAEDAERMFEHISECAADA